MGVVAYEMLTGRKPFNIESLEGNASINLYEMQKDGVKVSPKQLRPGLSDEADKLIMQTLVLDPKNRLSSAEEFGNKLYKALVETVAIPQTKVKSVLPTVIVLAVLLIVGAVGGKFLLSSTSGESTPSPTAIVSVTNRLSYSVELSEFRNGKRQESFPITGVTIVAHDKDRIWFNVSSQNAGYVYLINESPKPLDNGVPKYNILFPADKEDNQLLANKGIKLPNKDQAVEAIGAKGLETFWIVWSKHQITGLESLRSLPNPQDGGLVQDTSKTMFIKELLEKYSSEEAVKVKEDKKAKKMQVSSIENTIVVLLEIDHR
ncbi:MAG: hypothetical protein FD167_793 [bacterium]|nr:MAG: hypothetical protein FD167_793 [bacterium]